MFKHPWTKQIGLFIAFIGILYILVDFIFFPIYTRQNEEYQLVDLGEKSLDSAKFILAENGMELIISDSAFSPEIPFNYIISQVPKAYSTVKYGRRVYVTVSKGIRKIGVPDLKGLSLKEAEFTLQSLGLKIESIFYGFSPDFPKDVVINQNIKAFTEFKSGDKINITLSKGLDVQNIPIKNYRMILINVAKKDAQKLGLNVKIIFVKNDDYTPGTVIEQSIEAGSIAQENQEIQFTVVE